VLDDEENFEKFARFEVHHVPTSKIKRIENKSKNLFEKDKFFKWDFFQYFVYRCFVDNFILSFQFLKKHIILFTEKSKTFCAKYSEGAVVFERFLAALVVKLESTILLFELFCSS